MLQKFMSRLRDAKQDETGSIIPIFAIMLLAILVLIGFSLDFRRIASADARLQTAVDAATLAAAQTFAENTSLSDAQRLSVATDAFNATLDADLQGASFGLSVQSISLQTGGATNEGILATVGGDLPLAFGGLFGQSSVSLTADSGAEARVPQEVEIVLALDNTVSMFSNNRFNLMRSAAKDFTNTLLDSSAGPGAISIGIVPWASTVNINSERPRGFDVGAAASRNVSAAGSRTVPSTAFENRSQYLLAPEDEIVYTTAQMQEDFQLVDWRGCIRTAPDERIVSPSGNVLRRLTDDPVPGMRWHANYLEPHLRTVPFSGSTSSFSGDADALAAGLGVEPGRALQCNPNLPNVFNNSYLGEDHACAITPSSNTLNVAEACLSDPNEFAYFNQGGALCAWRDDIFPWTSIRPTAGPNMNCPVAMLGLSEDRGQIIDKLDEMYPVPPGTHADIGLMWSLRMLSPQSEWADFFGQSTPAGYTDPGNRKIMVLLTDGENFYPRLQEGYYGCSNNSNSARGSAGPCWVPGNIGAPNRDALDGLMIDACEAIREDYGIELFTIAVDITSSRTIDLLADCADDPNRAFNISASEINAVFDSIAAQELRLLQ